MKRRTILKRLGTAGAATIGITGTASASRAEIADHEIDVSDISGEIELSELLARGSGHLTPEMLGKPASTRYTISEDAVTITLDDCCEVCCLHPAICDCICCECVYDGPTCY